MTYGPPRLTPPPPKENVDHPSHYGGDNVYEHIKVADAWGLNYRLGNCTKYICRAGKKTANPLEDLKKALWYLQSEIDRVEKEGILTPAKAREKFSNMDPLTHDLDENQ